MPTTVTETLEASEGGMEDRAVTIYLASVRRVFYTEGRRFSDPEAVPEYSLLIVEGKVFMSVLAKRLITYMLANKNMDTSVQKVGVPGVSGCLEHTNLLTQLIKEAKTTKGDLTVLWLDLANAYGTVPHKLVDLILKKYHVPLEVSETVETLL